MNSPVSLFTGDEVIAKSNGITFMIYRERYRPQFHFTARSGGLSDPNGLVYHAGEYHLFFQHVPHGAESGSVTWGHAVSQDLVRWHQLPNAISPYAGGTIFSGSAVVDSLNASGLQGGDAQPILAFFTHARKPFAQALAYSNDRGRSFQLYRNGAPVVPNQRLDEGERDPKVFWHEPSGKWIMALWVGKDTARILTSANLTCWEHASDFTGPGFFECPDLFELPVPGAPGASKWLLLDAAFHYWLGSFDGREFVPETGPLRGDHGRCFYAAQTWNNLRGRTVQIGWMRGGKYPGMPFNQQMTFPCELTLQKTPQGIRLHRGPVAELQSLRDELLFQDSFMLRPGMNPLEHVLGDVFEIRLLIATGSSASICLGVHGQQVRYSLPDGVLYSLGNAVPIKPQNGCLELHLLVDRTSIEVFGNRGAVAASDCFLPATETTRLNLKAQGGNVSVREMSVHRLRSIWTPPNDAGNHKSGEPTGAGDGPKRAAPHP